MRQHRAFKNSLAAVALVWIGASAGSAAFFQLAHASADGNCGHTVSKYLARLFLTSDFDLVSRPGYSDVLRLYKNDDSFFRWFNRQTFREDEPPRNILSLFESSRSGAHPIEKVSSKTVDLRNSPELEKEHLGLCVICDWLVDLQRMPREYAFRVMSLRKGDKVVFDGKEIVLGRFLGRGNANHTWEIQGRDDEVLKIPLYSGPQASNLRSKDTSYASIYGTKSGRIVAQHFYELSKHLEGLEIPRVRVIEAAPDFSYTIVTRVRGQQTGRDFLLHEFAANPTDPVVLAKRDLLRKRILQYARFVGQGHYFRYGEDGQKLNQEAFLSESRQYLYDGKEWVLVDWE